MMDTILISTIQEMKPEQLRTWTKQTTENFDGIKIRYISNHPAARFTYYPTERKLFIETSLPKLVFQNNYTMLQTDTDREISMKTLVKHVEALIKTEIPDPERFSVHKIDACYNFQVGAHVDDYLNYFSNLNLPYHGLPITFQDKTVTWPGKSQGLKFYDKQHECRDQSAHGILRMELRIQHQSEFRKLLDRDSKDQIHLWDIEYRFLKDLLNEKLKCFFGRDTAPSEDEITCFLENFSPRKALSLIGFLQVKDGRKNLLLKKSTYYRYLRETRSINYGSTLEPLKIGD